MVINHPLQKLFSPINKAEAMKPPPYTRKQGVRLRQLLNKILAVNADNLWTHAKYGYSVSRRNGKNEVIAIREMYGLMQGEHIIHTFSSRQTDKK